MPEGWVRSDETPAASRLVVVLSVLATVAVVAGWWSWSDRGHEQTASRASDVTIPHRAADDRAACRAFGSVLERTEAAIPAVALLGVDATRRDFETALPIEIATLDSIAVDYPGADYRLIDALSKVADGSSLVIGPRDGSSLLDLIAVRADAVNAAHGACRTIASFDSHRLEPIGAAP